MLCPTAQMSVADRASTEDSSLKNPGLGLVTTLHAVPSQCSASVVTPAPGADEPTVHASVADAADTPRKLREARGAHR
jgi:hypothetical protein